MPATLAPEPRSARPVAPRIAAPEHPARRDWTIFILALGIAIRFAGIGLKPIWEDEAWTFHTATAPEGIVAVSGLDPHPLSFYGLYRLLPAWFFQTDWAFRLPVAVFSSAALLLMWHLLSLARFERRFAFWTLALFAVLPVNVRYAYEARAYALAQMFSLAVLAGYLWYRHRPTRRRLALLVLAAALSAHLDGFGLATPFAVFLHALWSFRRNKVSRAAAMAMFLGVLAALPYYAFRIHHMMQAGGVHHIDESPDLLMSVAARVVELSPLGVGRDPLPSRFRWAIFPLAGACLLALLAGVRRFGRRASGDAAKLLLILTVVTPAAYIAMSLLCGTNLIHKKYLLIIVAGLVPLYVSGALQVAKNRAWLVAVLALVLPLGVTAQMLAAPGGRADWRSIYLQMRPDMQAGDAYVQEIQENYPLYSFSALRAYAWRDGITIPSNQLHEYVSAVPAHDASLTLDEIKVPGSSADGGAESLRDFIARQSDGRVWTLSTDWMARGRRLDLSEVADPIRRCEAGGVRATLWRLRPGA